MIEPKNMDSSPKVGVYICHCGGNISDVIDVKKVADEAGKIPGVALSLDYMFMCSDPGQQKIKEAIREGRINRVIVAACSPRLHELTFRRALTQAGLNPYLLEQVNIREQGSWVHKMDHEGATDKAIRLVRGAVEKVKLAKPLDTIEIKSLPAAVVIGAGPAGMRAASDLSRRGSTVVLLEKSPFTGGNAARLGKVYPTEENSKDIIGKMAAEIEGNPGIRLMPCTEVIDATGGIGSFLLKIRQMPRGVSGTVTFDEFRKAEALCPVETDDGFNYGISKRKAIYMPYEKAYPALPAIDWDICTRCGKCGEVLKDRLDLNGKEEITGVAAGVVIVATGFGHYEPYTGEYGYKTIKNVVTLQQLMRMLDEEGPTGGRIIYSGKKVKNIGFIHCVGSRELEGVKNPPDGRPLNAHCSRVCCTATLQAINEIKEKYPDVNMLDFYQDIRTYGRDHEVMYYDKASRNGTLFFRYDPGQLPEVSESNGRIMVKMKDLLSAGEEIEAELDLLVLSAGIMPGMPGAIADKFKMPQSSDRFLQEVHPKLRPVETAIGGMFLAGTAQAPFDMTETTAAAGAAAVKAASILEGGSVHLEPFVACVDREKCKGHGLCVKACPAKGAIYMNEKENKAEVNPMLCISCGNCVAVCPERAVEVQGFEIIGFEKIVEEIVREG